ncbi:MAG TPA: DinB family protein [Thermomicrobiales bacterium]|nr:DinB family protein [Thermomicrobiales bacterium]
MGDHGAERPKDDEFPPSFGRYIDLVPDGDIVAILEAQLPDLEALLASFAPAQARWRPAAGEWNALQIVGHLADVERIFSYRALRCARVDAPTLTSMDQDEYMAASNFAERAMPDVAAEFGAVRRATVALLRGLDPTAWARRGRLDGQPISVRAIAYICAGHMLHHLADLRRYPELSARTG